MQVVKFCADVQRTAFHQGEAAIFVIVEAINLECLGLGNV